MDKNLPFTAPAGYFSSLPERVAQRCKAQDEARARREDFQASLRVRFAAAAGIALLIGLSYASVKHAPSLMQPDSEAPYAYYLSPLDVEHYLVASADEEDSALGSEEVAGYLLCDNFAGYLAVETYEPAADN